MYDCKYQLIEDMFKFCTIIIFLTILFSCNKHSEKGILSEGDPNVLVKKYPNTQLVAMKVQIKNELYDGKFEAYYRSGKKKAEGLYKKGLLNGYYIRFREDGSIISKENYKRNRLDSVNLYYRNDGTLEFERNYYGGQEHGPYKSYYPNGNLFQDFNYVYTRREGKQQVFYPNKQLKWKDRYINGYSTGEYQGYTEEGKPISHGYSIVSQEINEIKLSRKFTYQFKLNKPAKELEFYSGEIKDGKRDYRTVLPLKRKGDWFILPITVNEGYAIIANTFIIAAFKSKEGRETTVVKDIKIALTNF